MSIVAKSQALYAISTKAEASWGNGSFHRQRAPQVFRQLECRPHLGPSPSRSRTCDRNCMTGCRPSWRARTVHESKIQITLLPNSGAGNPPVLFQ